MATATAVKDYVCCWLQMGLSIEADATVTTPACTSFLTATGFSAEFEQLWQALLEAPHRYSLAGASIATLLRPSQDIMPCGRCGLSVAPMSLSCPCATLPWWPSDTSLPPRMADPELRLHRMATRLEWPTHSA